MFRVQFLAALLGIASSGPSPLRAQTDWPTYGGNPAGTRYSTLAQINASNVGKLSKAWTFHMSPALRSDSGPTAETMEAHGPLGRTGEATPLVVNGRMYLTTPYNQVVALEPETGKLLWAYALPGGNPAVRGLEYYGGDRQSPPQIVFGTSDAKLISLNAITGKPVPGFGNEGVVDLKEGVLNGFPNAFYDLSSPPVIYGDLVITGAHTQEAPSLGAAGDTRAWDMHTGKLVWQFHSVPRPGETGHETWEGESWKGRSGTNVWGMMTVDVERGIVYMPFGQSTYDYYGGDRKGANLFGNSVVAVDVKTGRYKWHFQTIHHDLWDADPPAPPGLFDIVRNGRTIPALAVTTKSGYLYILNRETGEPIFGVEERPVPKSDVPGELAFPTQPIPVKPPPLARVGYKPEDLVTAADTTAEHARACQELIDTIGGVYNAGPFTPWLYRAPGAPPKSSLVFPGGLGGANWGGTAFDPRSGYIFVVTQDSGALGWMEKTPDGSPVPYDKTSPERAGPGRGNFDVNMPGGSWPCQKPPWGRLTAVNSSTGDIAWQVRLGVTDQLPEGKQNTGRPALAGAIVTAGGVLFIASTDDNRFRAFDAKTGNQLWVTRLERRGNADPITYQGRNGKQYVAVVATDTVAVYALP